MKRKNKKSSCCYLLQVSIVFLSVILNSCNYFKDIKTSWIIRHEYGKEINFSWPGYEVLTDTVYDYYEIKAPLTIVTYINEELCEECLSSYLKTAEKFINLFHSDSIEFVCIAYPRAIEKLKYALSLAGTDSLKVRMIYDSDNLYLSSNSITQLSSGYNAFLIDENHKVILMGDPIRSESVYELYKTTIQKKMVYTEREK